MGRIPPDRGPGVAASPDHYPPGTVRGLLATDLLTPATRAVIEARLAPAEATEPRFFHAGELRTLRAACARLIPQADRATPVDLALNVDARLAGNMSDGWRYDALPPDGDAYRRGLAGLDETARAVQGRDFTALDPDQQDAVLALVQGGTPPGPTWQTLSAARFFEETLAELAECYYSDPISQEEIGYVGMADAAGWHALGLNRLDPQEPLPLDPHHG